jgi:hypothetical protein
MRNASLTPKTIQWIVFGFSVLVGACIWIASPYFTGQKEPWDSLSFYYRGSLLIGGFVAGSFAPRRFWLWAVGLWFGQMIGFIGCIASVPRVGPLAPLGFLVFLPMYSLWGLLGSCVGAGTGKLFRRFILGRAP